ncbi:MAG: leucine-rich repeat domain-containing protein, partial [Clostridia bacterium]|nr:leucine-rich repeat domain-containing protein [Clostridia bacterium]
MKDYEYAELQNLKEAVIEEGVKKISKYAFENCFNLQKVTIPSSVTIIEEGAFLGCCSLREVVIKDGLKTIENMAFKDCFNLQKLDLPKSIKSVSD